MGIWGSPGFRSKCPAERLKLKAEPWGSISNPSLLINAMFSFLFSKLEKNQNNKTNSWKLRLSQQGPFHTSLASASVCSLQPLPAPGRLLATAPGWLPCFAPCSFCSRSQQALNEVEWGSNYSFNEDENPDSHLVLSSQLQEFIRLFQPGGLRLLALPWPLLGSACWLCWAELSALCPARPGWFLTRQRAGILFTHLLTLLRYNDFLIASIKHIPKQLPVHLPDCTGGRVGLKTEPWEAPWTVSLRVQFLFPGKDKAKPLMQAFA